MNVDDPLLPALIYEAVHRGTPGDVTFYRDACRGARTVLEIGCGAGRLAHALAADGADVVGVEIDSARAALCRRRAGEQDTPGRVTVLRADATRLPLAPGRLFDRAVIAYNTLCALDGDQAVLAVLEGVARRLRPDGALYLDLYVAELEGDDGDAPVSPFAGPLDDDDDGVRADDRGEHDGGYEQLCSVVFDGVRVDVLEREVLHRDPRRLDLHYRYQVADADAPRGVVAREIDEAIPHLALPPRRLEALLQRAGLEVVTRVGDFAGPFGPETEQLAIGAVPREPSETR